MLKEGVVLGHQHVGDIKVTKPQRREGKEGGRVARLVPRAQCSLSSLLEISY